VKKNKIALPKYYHASGFRLKVILVDELNCHGRFNLGQSLMEIRKGLDNYQRAETFIHECFESSLVANSFRWDDCDNHKGLFIFDHAGLSSVCQEVGRGVLDLLKANKGRRWEGEEG